MENKSVFITTELPDGINFFCGLSKHTTPKGTVYGITWDTDIRYALPLVLEKAVGFCQHLENTWNCKKIVICPVPDNHISFLQ